jgi:hypothetical protein
MERRACRTEKQANRIHREVGEGQQSLRSPACLSFAVIAFDVVPS